MSFKIIFRIIDILSGAKRGRFAKINKTSKAWTLYAYLDILYILITVWYQIFGNLFFHKFFL